MTDERATEIRRLLDEDLSLDAFDRDSRPVGEAATQFFQDLFVRVLGFAETASPTGDTTWQELPVHEWPNAAGATAARLFAEAGEFRVVYVELAELTRPAERDAVRGLTRSDRTADDSLLVVFHAPGRRVWHLVTPYEEGTTTRRPVLRRYRLGDGQTHRTAANALSNVDAGEEGLAERVDAAFRVDSVTEAFYEDYKRAFDTLAEELRQKGLAVEDADRYAHATLNRLLFCYYLQKKGWLGERKDFVRWFHARYRASDDEGVFHQKWLSALFDGLNGSTDSDAGSGLPAAVASAIADTPNLNDEFFTPSDRDAFVSDAALASVIDGFLEQYNFAIAEESPYDADVAVDPAMLGKIYESLIAERERGDAGVFYTPRAEVDLMCRLALYEQLREQATIRDEPGERRLDEFVFAEPRNWDAGAGAGADIDTRRLEAILDDLRIVDPACGSGAFLIGMKQVLTELYRKLGVTPDADLERRIVEENLHGVDVEAWAVQIAEFRLWLSLVEEKDTALEAEPAPPSVSFGLHTGDSLVQTVDGERVSLGSLTRNAGERTRRALRELRALEGRQFEGRSEREAAVREKRVDVLDAYVDERTEALRRSTAQRTSTGSPAEPNTTDTAASIERLESLRDRIADADGDCFVWELDFASVVMGGGFDVVIGNPPYVRGRDIVPQSYTNEQLDAMPEGRVDDLSSAYKTHLREYVVEAFGVEPYRTSDLYLYFFFRGFDLLAPNGTLSFVTSNSWLNTRYGKRLQEGLLRFTDLQYVFDNRSTRTFTDAAVNTVITIANRSPARLVGDTSFVAVREAYDEFAAEGAIRTLLADSDGDDREIEFRDETFGVTQRPEYRAVTVPDEALWTLGGGTLGTDPAGGAGTTPQGTYGGGRWALYHRAPDIYFRILDRAGDIFHELSTYVEDVKTGAYSGLNDFYYFETDRGDAFEERIDERFLVPFVRRPEQIRTPLFDPATFETNVFVCRKTKAELQREGYAAALEYVEWGERQERADGTPWPAVPSVSGRDPGWWALPEKDSRPTNLLVGYVVDTRFTAAFSDDPVTSDRCFHRIYGDPDRLRRLHAIFCSSLGPFLIELTGTANLGQGALKFETRLLKRLPIPDPDGIEYAEVADAMAALGDRPIGSVFEEIGAETPGDVALETVADDRRAVDRYVLGDVIGLGEAEQLELYRQLVEMVGDRIGKARSG